MAVIAWESVDDWISRTPEVRDGRDILPVLDEEERGWSGGRRKLRTWPLRREEDEPGRWWGGW